MLDIVEAVSLFLVGLTFILIGLLGRRETTEGGTVRTPTNFFFIVKTCTMCICYSSIDSSFLSDLKDSAGFANPCATENLKEALGIRGYNSQTKPTLILDMQK